MGVTLTCAFANWSPGLGDNHLMGWVTVAVYLLAALGSARAMAAAIGPDRHLRRERLFWALMVLLLALLAVNKQLDLQSLFTAIGRCHAQLNGWYELRDRVQVWFVVGVGLSGLAGLGFLVWLLRGLVSKLWPALLGAGLVSLFVLIRAASFHHVDALIGLKVGGVRVNWLLELPGPILVLLVAWRRSRR
jgi:hypothetical protein